MYGKIFDIQHCSLSDGNGIRTAIFLKGCPLRCAWCHNPESQSTDSELLFYAHKCTGCGKCLRDCAARRLENGRIVVNRKLCTLCGKCAEICPAGANEICGKIVSAEEVIAEAEKDKPFYSSGGIAEGGITISGGEPAAQAEFSLELIRLAQEKGIDTAIETCGCCSPDFFTRAAKAGSTFLYDIKHLNATTHQKLTGVGNALILENLKRLFDINAKIVVRLPLIPGANDDEVEFEALKEFLTIYREKFQRAEIIPYHVFGKSKEAALGRTGVAYNADIAKQRADSLCLYLQETLKNRVRVV